MLQFFLSAVLSILWIDFISRRFSGVLGLVAYALSALILVVLIAHYPLFTFAKG